MLAGPSPPVCAISCGEDAALILKRDISKYTMPRYYRAVTVESAILEAIHKKLTYDCLIEASHIL